MRRPRRARGRRGLARERMSVLSGPSRSGTCRTCSGACRTCSGACRTCSGARRTCSGTRRTCSSARRTCSSARRNTSGTCRSCSGAYRTCSSTRRTCSSTCRTCSSTCRKCSSTSRSCAGHRERLAETHRLCDRRQLHEITKKIQSTTGIGWDVGFAARCAVLAAARSVHAPVAACARRFPQRLRRRDFDGRGNTECT